MSSSRSTVCASFGSATPSRAKPKPRRHPGRAAPYPTSLGQEASLAVNVVDNYFNYFTEIEEHFQRRRGTTLLLSTLDWALIEMWKDAGIPLEAVLRGIDAAFDKYDQRPSK